MRTLVFLYLFAPGLLFAQTPPSSSGNLASAGTPLGAVFFEEGLIGLPSSRLQEPRSAVIPLGQSEYFVSLIWGKEEAGNDQFWVIIRRPDSTFSASSTSMKPDAYGTLSDTIELAFDASSSATTPLYLRVLPAHNALLYRWPGGGTALAGGVPTAGTSTFPVGEPAPDFAVPLLQGGLFRLSEVRGRIVVINTWAVYCSPCIAEMPGLNTLVKKYKDDDVVFLAISADTEEDLRAFLDEQPFLYDHALTNEDAMQLFGGAFPRHVIVDANGIVALDNTGGWENTHEALDQVIATLLADQ